MSDITVEHLLAALGEELDLEGAVRPSRRRDPDIAGAEEFERLPAPERAAAVTGREVDR